MHCWAISVQMTVLVFAVLVASFQLFYAAWIVQRMGGVVWVKGGVMWKPGAGEKCGKLGGKVEK